MNNIKFQEASARLQLDARSEQVDARSKHSTQVYFSHYCTDVQTGDINLTFEDSPEDSIFSNRTMTIKQSSLHDRTQILKTLIR